MSSQRTLTRLKRTTLVKKQVLTIVRLLYLLAQLLPYSFAIPRILAPCFTLAMPRALRLVAGIESDSQ